MKLIFNVNKSMLYILFIWLVIIELLLVIFHVAVSNPNSLSFKIFDLDGESTIPSWFSSIQLFLIGLIFWVKGLQSNNIPIVSNFFFKVAGTGFIYLSADEASQFHEKIGNMLRRLDNGANVIPHFEGGYGHGFWILPYLLIGITIVFIFRKDIFAFFRHYKSISMIMSGGLTISVLGAVGLEIIGYGLRDSNKYLPYLYEVAAEEFFEMLGFSFVLYGASLMLIDEK